MIKNAEEDASRNVKAIFFCTFLALVIGMGAGWMLRGEAGGGSGVEERSSSAKASKTEDRNTAAIAPAGPVGGPHEKKSRRRPPEEGKRLPELPPGEMAKQMMAALKDKHAKRTEARIAELTAKLGLDPAQAAKLREFFEKQMPGPEITVSEDGRGVRMESRGAGSKGNLDDFMQDLLSAQQSDSYERLKETERDQRVEARTLREMASVTQAIELREDQRDAVYEILQEEARNDEGSGARPLMAGMSMMPPLGSGPGEAADSVVALKVAPGAEGAGTPESMSRAKEQEQARIDEKVNRMSGVLDQAQLDQYRAHLEQGSLLGGP